MPEEVPIRLQKYLAEQGVCSRRAAEALIREQRVEINGALAELGMKVTPGTDTVRVDGRSIRAKTPPQKVIALNKPKGVLCSRGDPHHKGPTVFDLIPGGLAEGSLYYAGRLDKESEGLLILTNDGDLANRLTHPTGGVIKRYRVTLNKPFDPAKIPKMLRGINYEGERLFATKVIPATHGPDSDRRLEIHLEQGRKREIRRLLLTQGYRVKKLIRFQVGAYVMKRLGPGELKVLKPREIDLLFKNLEGR